jgi:hypothetical protein
VVHNFNSKSGYIVSGNIVESSAEPKAIQSIQYPIPKVIGTRTQESIEKYVEQIRSMDTGIIEQLFSDERNVTAKFGIDEDSTQSSVSKSVEAEIGLNNVFLNKKPLSSIFAGNGFGLIVPVYKDMRAVLGFNRFDMQDMNVLGFLWKKGDVIPAHDDGEFLIHLLNHSKISMKEDGHGILQFKGLKIEINTSLTEAKTTPTTDGNLVIEIEGGVSIEYDGADLILENGSKITINSSGVDVT